MCSFGFVCLTALYNINGSVCYILKRLAYTAEPYSTIVAKITEVDLSLHQACRRFEFAIALDQGRSQPPLLPGSYVLHNGVNSSGEQ
jgi:hypothetical protein